MHFFLPSEKITLNISHFREIMGKIALKIHVEGQILKKILQGVSPFTPSDHYFGNIVCWGKM